MTLGPALIGGAATPVALAADDQPDRLLLLLDASGSMKEHDATGKAKIVGAERALAEVITTLPEVGLRLYGAAVKGKGPGSCTDTQLAVPIGTGNRPALQAAVAHVRPVGETPIACMLRQAAKDPGQLSLDPPMKGEVERVGT